MASVHESMAPSGAPRMLRAALLQLAINGSLRSASALPGCRAAAISVARIALVRPPQLRAVPMVAATEAVVFEPCSPREFGCKARTTLCPARHRDQPDQPTPSPLHASAGRASLSDVCDGTPRLCKAVRINTLSSFPPFSVSGSLSLRLTP
jgi:hypothetical protein